MQHETAREVREVIGVSLAFGLSHSLLAARPVKALAARCLGRRWRRGWYRVLYMAASAVSFAWAWRRLRGVGEELWWSLRRPWSGLARLGQLAGLALVGWTIWANGVAAATGLAPLRSWWRGHEPAPEPAAQGPALDSAGDLAIVGPFRWCRHPGNLAALLVFGLWPRMTLKRAVIAALTAAYAVLGSLHEEQRLLARYGEQYQRYRRAVPFLLPGKRR